MALRGDAVELGTFDPFGKATGSLWRQRGAVGAGFKGFWPGLEA